MSELFYPEKDLGIILLSSNFRGFVCLGILLYIFELPIRQKKTMS